MDRFQSPHAVKLLVRIAICDDSSANENTGLSFRLCPFLGYIWASQTVNCKSCLG